MEGLTDDELAPDIVPETFDDDERTLSRTEVRARSTLAQHLRPSIFPAQRDAIVACTRDEDAPATMIEQLERLSPERTFANVEQVWEALGGQREERVTPHETPEPRRFDFEFDRVHRLLAMPFGISPGSAFVVVNPKDGRFTARFGRWCVDTPLENVVSATVTGPYWTPKTAGPPHLSLSDRGLTFATNDAAGVCIEFDEPVRGIEPTGVLRHPGLTVTVADPDAFRAYLLTAIERTGSTSPSTR
jgi:hypothetical protein